MIARINRTYLPGLMEELFRNDYSDRIYTGQMNMCVPSVNIIEEEQNYVLEVAAPGLNRDEFRISLENAVLTISSERKEDKEQKEGRYLKREFGFAAFRRSFNLPDSVDASRISASHVNGVLRISLPLKEEVKTGPRKIEIA